MNNRLLTKFFVFIMVLCILSSQAVFATDKAIDSVSNNNLQIIENSADTENAKKIEVPEIKKEEVITTAEVKKDLKGATSDIISLDIYIGNADNFIPQNMVVGVYSAKKQFLGAQKINVSNIGETFHLMFRVPEYYLGEILYLKMFSGGEKIQYGFDFYSVGDMIPLQTYTYFSQEKNTQVYGDKFSVTATPVSGRFVQTYANNWELYLKNPAKIINGVCMIPMYEYLEALSISDCAFIDASVGRVEIKAKGHSALFFLNGNDMYADGKVTYTEVTPQKINGVIYLPFRFLVESLGGSVTSKETDDRLRIYSVLTNPKVSDSEFFVNNNGIKSKTNYLIWVSKSNYKVTVFANNNGIWKEVKSFPCSIGAPSTPTITGQFEYFSRESRWTYPTYYVGPIMRFYRGYALHSTLLRYDGSPADGRLRKQISHGCVRVEPQNINWMVDTVPLYTKVYVTN